MKRETPTDITTLAARQEPCAVTEEPFAVVILPDVVEELECLLGPWQDYLPAIFRKLGDVHAALPARFGEPVYVFHGRFTFHFMHAFTYVQAGRTLIVVAIWDVDHYPELEVHCHLPPVQI